MTIVTAIEMLYICLGAASKCTLQHLSHSFHEKSCPSVLRGTRSYEQYVSISLEQLYTFPCSSETTLSTTDYSYPTSHTVPGPGALSEKVIHALGKTTLCGAEYLIVLGRFQVIQFQVN